MMGNTRLQNLRAILRKSECDALFVTNAYNRRYLSGFTGSAGYLIITMDDAVLFTDFRYRTQAPKEVIDFTVIEHGASAQASIYEWLQSKKVKRVGFEQTTLTYAEFRDIEQNFQGLTLVPTADWIEQLRMVKDDAELHVMQEAAKLADDTFEHMIHFVKPGMTEKEVALEIEFFMRRHGATSSSFETIVASGERSALPHGIASDRVIGRDEFVKLDFGAYYKGYCSDITRTLFIGTPTKKHVEIYQIVLEAQLAGVEQIRIGMTGKQADALTRDIIKRYGYNGYFGHGTGHGLGMEIHEAPRLSPTGEVVLKSGMTVTIEPGIYIPDFGGVRIEDDVVLTPNGAVRLTQSTKELIVL